MNTTKPLQHSLLSLKRQALFVLFICYIPHITTEPWWQFIIFSVAIGYRLMADYYNYSRIPAWLLFLLTIVCLSFLYGNAISVELFIHCFLIFIMFKCLEMYTLRDVKVIVICNFFLIFSALIIIQELWVILYLFIAILANLSIMLKLSSEGATWKQMSSISGKQLLIAIPLSILLFFVFPRVAPIWGVPTALKGSVGFNDVMRPGSVAELFNDESIAMQITFKKTPILNGYWRGVILNLYTGESWHATWGKYFALNELNAGDTADYEIILEPNQKRWLFYEGYPVAGEPNLVFSPDNGLIRQNKEAFSERFIYSLKVQAEPYQVLSRKEFAEATRLPSNIDLRLKTWTKEQFVKSHQDVKAFIAFLHNYIHQQDFWYTLTPPLLDANKDQMDTFWFDTRKGFCEHYASAVTFILRTVGIPARVILGYYGGQWNPISNSITIQQSDAHAWIEYWQEGIGWQQLDPTSFVAPERIDKAIQNRENYLNQEDNFNIANLPFGREMQFYLESFQFFTERWFLYYNETSQQSFLKNAGLGQWNTGQLLQVSVVFLMGCFILLWLSYQWWQRRTLDAILVEYHLLQKEFRRFNIATEPSVTLKKQCKSLINTTPVLTPIISAFFSRYEELRLKKHDSKENKKETIALFKKLRHALRRRKVLRSNRNGS